MRYGFQNTFATEPSVALESSLTSVTAVPNSNEFWAAGYYNDRNDGYYKAFVEHWDGLHWSQPTTFNIPRASYLYGITAITSGNVWAVGDYTDPNSGNSRTLAEALLPPSAPAHTTSYYEETTSTMNHYYQGCHAAYT